MPNNGASPSTGQESRDKSGAGPLAAAPQAAGGGRVAFADWLRIMACFMVMLVHASENFYGADSSGLAGNMSLLASEENRLWVSIYDGVLGRVSVPLFMMVSAFLLVPMKEGMTMGQFYRRRLLRVVPPMLVFAVVYCLLPLAWGGMTWEQSLADLKHLPWNFPSMAGHLWFMYPLISLYIIIPVVSPWLERASARDERTFLYLFVFSSLLPWLHRFVQQELWGECFWNGFHMLWYCSGYLGYLVMAHYIRYHMTWSRTRRLCVGGLCFVVGGLFTGWSFWWRGVPGELIETPMLEWSWEFCTLNVVMATFGLFTLLTTIERPAPRLVTEVSKLSFGMYLMHLLYLAPIAGWVIGGDVAHPLLPTWLAIPVIAIASYLCCALTTKLLTFLPGSKWAVGA